MSASSSWRRSRLIEGELERWAFSVQAMHPMNDKQARLRVAACYIKNGPRGSHFDGYE